MAQNLIPNDGAGAKLASWTPTVTGSATVPVGTYSATSGDDSLPALTISATGTSGGVGVVGPVLEVEPETVIALAFIAVASSATPTMIPFTVTYKDGSGNTIATHVPIASACAVASKTEYTAITVVPDGAVSATVAMCNLGWSSTGGYTTTFQSPVVAAL
jgi:hypothetical protein